jgi:23S rRNA (cytosine1962-C5)-methyltransferase
MARALPTIEVSSSLERALRRGHPWVYRNHLPRDFRGEAGWVRVKSGRFTGYALLDESSPIALRVFSARGVPDAHWIAERVLQAWQLRTGIRASQTSAFRWLFGEGDGLPGITVDLYGGFAIVVTYADSLQCLLPDLVTALRQTTSLSGIAHKSRGEALTNLWGRLPPRELVIEERGVRLHADLHEGQKTGLFLDHRDNRQYIRELASEISVLNLFAYTGAFSLSAALGRASRVTSVDAAAPSMARAQDNFRLNGLATDSHEFVVSDVFEFLDCAGRERQRYELVICDPPSFAKSKEQVENAKKAYVRLNAGGMLVTKRGGLYAAASCTAPIGPEEFRETLREAAEAAKCRLQIIHEAGQAPDHPVMAHHPEGRYLKFIVGRVLDLA